MPPVCTPLWTQGISMMVPVDSNVQVVDFWDIRQQNSVFVLPQRWLMPEPGYKRFRWCQWWLLCPWRDLLSCHHRLLSCHHRLPTQQTT